MSANFFPIPESLIRDFNLIACFNLDQLTLINNYLFELSKDRKHKPSPNNLKKVLIDEISNQEKYKFSTDISPSDLVESLLRQLLSLNQIIRHKNIESESQLVDDLIYSINNDDDNFEPDEKVRWKELSGVFKSMLTLPIVSSTSKGNELAYDYANLYQKARIITDLRPIFDHDTNIIGGVIGYTLRLEYDNSGTDHNISIALDHNDVLELKELCERAILKSEKASIITDQNYPTYITGKD